MNSYKNKYSQATKIFQILCRKYLISPDEYGEKYRRGSRDCIRSILSGSFDETFWFTLPKKRFDIAREKFKNILIKNNIEPDGYEKRFRHRISEAAYLLQWDQELDLKYWLTPKPIPTTEETTEIIRDLCYERGIEISEYETKYRKFMKRLRYGIRKNQHYNKKWIEGRFTISDKENRKPKNILKEVKSLISPERKVGLIRGELPNPLAERIRAFYPDHLRGINTDLGLSKLPKLKEYKELALESPSRQQLRIEEINKKIERLYEAINPRKITKLQDELLQISEEDEDLTSFEPDKQLLKDLNENINNALEVSCGYLYLKMWSLPEKTWFKVGITNSPQRRESEQNVLPVPSQTVYLLRLDSMEQARSVEKAIHKALADRRIRGSLNKELFQLSAQDYKALVMALQKLTSKLSSASIEDFQEVQENN